MSGLDSRARHASIGEFSGTKYDLVIIGGGITGAGILREASLRGLKVLLLEAEDFASGTSSKSTKLIHGGIRYLQMGHIHVVRESARERKRVHELAPHLAEPQWLMLPAGNMVEFLKYKIGVNLYEKLGLVESPDRHFNLSHQDLVAREPLLALDRYPHACIYREYLTDDARLVLANLRAGIEAGGSALNKMRVTGLLKENGETNGVRASCQITGEEVLIHARGVINAAGPWVESVCDLDGLPSEKPLVLSKGVHVVIPYERLPLNEMVLMIAGDKRPVFAIPRGDVVYLGTTDSRYEKKADVWPEVFSSELEYLFAPVQDYFNVSLTMADCLSTWAGLRPLIAQTGKSTKEISRKDEIWMSKSGLITIAGGKLTGYRKMAEDTVDESIQMLGLSAREESGDTPLPGGDFQGDAETFSSQIANDYQMSPEKALRLTRLYGSEVSQVIAMGSNPISDGSRILTGEVKWAIEEEGAITLEDVVYRRTRAAYYRPEEVPEMLGPVADLLAAELDWSVDKRNAEVESVRARFRLDTAIG